MNKEIQSIKRNLERVLQGEPWYGRSVYSLLEQVDPATAHIKPKGDAHSPLELIYHMNTWADFTLKRLENNKEIDLAAFEKMDWRNIDLKTQNWEKAVKEFTSIHNDIITLLDKKDDNILSEIVDYRQYNFRFLLNGLIQHDIYHLGQIAYIQKFLI